MRYFLAVGERRTRICNPYEISSQRSELTELLPWIQSASHPLFDMHSLIATWLQPVHRIQLGCGGISACDTCQHVCRTAWRPLIAAEPSTHSIRSQTYVQMSVGESSRSSVSDSFRVHTDNRRCCGCINLVVQGLTIRVTSSWCRVRVRLKVCAVAGFVLLRDRSIIHTSCSYAYQCRQHHPLRLHSVHSRVEMEAERLPSCIAGLRGRATCACVMCSALC